MGWGWGMGGIVGLWGSLVQELMRIGTFTAGGDAALRMHVARLCTHHVTFLHGACSCSVSHPISARRMHAAAG